MNETQTPNTRTPEPQMLDSKSPDVISIAKQRSLADRILAYSVVGSVLVNFGWLAWVSNSNLFGGGVSLADLKPQLIKIVKPPIPQKPKPKKKEKPPPPPPKQHKIPPKIKPLKQIKPPPPRPRQQPPRPQPTPIKQVAVAHTNNKFAKPTFEAPPPQENTDVGRPVESGNAPVAQPDPPVVHNDPPPVVHNDPPPVVHNDPPPVHHDPPRHKDVDVPYALSSIEGEFTLPEGLDTSTITKPTVEASWTVDERGHAVNIRVPSTGNAEVDRLIKEAIGRVRYQPAIHNGVPETATLTHTFALGV